MIIPSYIINQNTVLITGEYDKTGKLCTRVLEVEKSFLVDITPEKLIDDSIQYLGFDLPGAIKSSKKILGPMKMCPFMVNQPLGLCMFPVKSVKKPDCVWFVLAHVKKPEQCGIQTKVHLSHGHSIMVDLKLSAFKKRYNRAIDLCRITSERANCPVAFYLEPKSRYQLIKEPSGKYNFRELEKE
jgi:competence protein ComK